MGFSNTPFSGSNASPVLQLELQHSRSENLTTPHRIPILLPTPYLELPPEPGAETDNPPQPKGPKRKGGATTQTVHHTQQQHSAVQLAALALSPDHRGTTIPEPAEVRRHDSIGSPHSGALREILVWSGGWWTGVSTVQKRDTTSAAKSRNPPGKALRFCVFFDDEVVDVPRLRLSTGRLSSPQCSRNSSVFLILGVLALKTGR